MRTAFRLLPFSCSNTATILFPLFWLIICIPSAKSQEYWSPFYQNFSTDNFNLSTSNIAIEKDHHGLMMVGNFSGLLVIDGSKNHVLKIADGRVVNALHIGPKNQIYFASNNSLGYLTAGLDGKLSYEFIAKDLKGRVRKVESIHDSVFLLTERELLLSYHNKISSIGNSTTGFQNMFVYDNKLWIKELQQPLKISIGSKLQPINNALFPSTHLLGVQYEINKKLIFYSFPDYNSYSINRFGYIEELKNPYKATMQISMPYKAINNGSTIAISTRRKGLMLLYPDSTSKFFNQENGLNSDISAGISLDDQEAVWLALQNGLARIETNSSWSQWDKQNGLLDNINNVIKHNNTIYVSSMNGVYFLNGNTWQKVSGLSDRAFDLLSSQNKLYACGTESGLFSIEDSLAVRVTKLDKIWSIAQYTDNSILVPTENLGLYKVTDHIEKIEQKLMNPSLTGTPSSIHVVNKDSTWLAIKWEGIYLIKTKEDTAVYKKFSQQHGLPEINESEIITVGDRTLFTTSLGFYQLNKHPKNDSSDLFIPALGLPKLQTVVQAAVDQQGNIWYSTYDDHNEQILKKLSKQDDGSYKDKSLPLKRLPNQIISHIYIDPDLEGVIWITGTKGLYRYDENISTNTALSFNTRINKVSSKDSIIFNGFFTTPNDDGAPSFQIDQPTSYRPSLSYKSNDIKFEFSTTAYTLAERNEFSYYLEGLEKDWSRWTRNKQKEYSNLSPGTYTFHLKSRNLYETEGKLTTYTFSIIPPWYLTAWAKIIFVLLGLTIIWIIIFLYSYRLRMHRKHLKLLVADRTFEVMAQKKEIETQYKKLSEQTEEILQQSDQIALKNRDLEQHQAKILSVNNQLEEMNTYLEKKVEKRTAKIISTVEKLKQTNKELDTFIYKASHDLKGPLSRILGLSSLAKIETPSEKNIQYLDMIESTSKDMDILLSKLTQVHEIFNQKPKITPVLIEEILEDVKVKLDYLSQKDQSNINLVNKIKKPIRADHQLFSTVLYNLIENALIFKNPDLTVKHQIDIFMMQSEELVIIEVTDNGLGIEENLLEAIFDMFYRASDQSKGSGLGLYLVKIAVEKMRGKVEVSSVLGEKTKFTVSLPI